MSRWAESPTDADRLGIRDAHYSAHATEHEADAKVHDELAKQYDKAEAALAKEHSGK